MGSITRYWRDDGAEEEEEEDDDNDDIRSVEDRRVAARGYLLTHRDARVTRAWIIAENRTREQFTARVSASRISSFAFSSRPIGRVPLDLFRPLLAGAISLVAQSAHHDVV